MLNKGFRRIIPALIATIGVSGAVAANTVGQPVSGDQARVATLANEIVVTANRLPAGSSENVYEAQFASLFDQSGANCSYLRVAANRADGLPRNAYIALRRLASTLTTCGAGTAAIGGGRANLGGVPGFAVGGGSDYIR